MGIQYTGTNSYSTSSLTRSRHLRRDVRNALGSSSQPLPDLLQVLAAARALGALLDNASGGRFGIAIHDFAPPSRDLGQGEQAIPVGTAVDYVTEARRFEQERVERVREQLRAERVERERAERDGFDPWWGDRALADVEREKDARREDRREAEAFQAKVDRAERDRERPGLFDLRRDLGRAPTAQEWADARR